MAQDEAFRWLRLTCAALSVAHAAAFREQLCGTPISDSPFNMLMFQQHTAGCRRASVQEQPHRGSRAGIFVQPSCLTGHAASFRLPRGREAARQAPAKRQRTERRTSRGPNANGAGVWGTTNNSANVRPANRSVARGGGSVKTMTALYSAHKPQPVRVPGLRRPQKTPRSPPPSALARPALELQPGVGGEGEIDAAGEGSVAAPHFEGAAEQLSMVEITTASGAAGVSSAGETIENVDRLPPPPTAGNRQVGRLAGAASVPSSSASEGRARQGGGEVEEVTGGAAAGSAGGGDGEWCPRAARDRACEAVPMLSQAFRKFDEKHPGATIIYLAHSGSRMYGTSTPNSDVDVKGVFIPDREMEARLKEAKAKGSVGANAPESEVGPDAEESEGFTRPPSQLQEAGDGKQTVEKDAAFWYSTGDTRSSNTKDDMDMELVSLDKFFSSLLRGEVNGVETLHAMLVEDIGLISDPDILPLIVRERRWLVSKQLSSWVGLILSHLAKYRKVTHQSTVARRKAVQRRRELNAALLREARLGAAATATAATVPAQPVVGAAASGSSSSSRSTSASAVVAPTTGSAGEEDWVGGKHSTVPLPAAAVGGGTAGEKSNDRENATGHGRVEDDEEKRGVPNGAGELGVSPRSDAGEGQSSMSGVRRLGATSRGHGGDAAASSSTGGRRLGVISRGGVEVGRGKEEEEEEEEEEDEEELEAKELARKVRRGKLLLHARRGVMEAEELLVTGRLVFPLRPTYVKELLRLKELNVSPRKVTAIAAQAKRLTDIAARSALPDEVRFEKVAAVKAEAMKVYERRRHRRLPDLAEAGD
eukprot:g18891.t1